MFQVEDSLPICKFLSFLVSKFLHKQQISSPVRSLICSICVVLSQALIKGLIKKIFFQKEHHRWGSTGMKRNYSQMVLLLQRDRVRANTKSLSKDYAHSCLCLTAHIIPSQVKPEEYSSHSGIETNSFLWPRAVINS